MTCHPPFAPAGFAPPVLLASTHIKALDYVSLAELREHALDLEEAEAEAAAAMEKERFDREEGGASTS